MPHKQEVSVKGYTRNQKGRDVPVKPHFRHALVKQGEVVGFIKVDKFRGARLKKITPSVKFREGLKQLQASPQWRPISEQLGIKKKRKK